MNINLNTNGYGAGNNIQGLYGDNSRIMSGEERKAELIKAAVESVVSQTDMQNDMLDKILMDAGFKVTDGNKALVNMLMSDGKAVTKENLVELNRFVKLVGSENADKALFFMNSDLKPTFSNGEKLVELSNHMFEISSEAAELTKVMDDVFNEPIIRNEILTKFNDAFTAESILKDGGFEKAVSEINKSIDNMIFKLSESQMGENENNNNSVSMEETSSPLQKFADDNKAEILNILKNAVEKGSYEVFEKEVNALYNKNTDVKNPMGKDVMGKGNSDVFQKEPNILNSKNIDAKDIIDRLFKDSPELKENIQKALGAEKEFVKVIKDKLNFNVKGKSGGELEKFVKEFKNNINIMKESLQSSGAEKYDNALKAADNILSRADFMNELKDTAMIQIPVMINNKEETAEIYVFNNRKGNGKKGRGLSAVISLDTANIGHFEAYAVKEGSNVNIQFRLGEETGRVVKNNIEILNNYLKDKGLNLQSYTFKKIDEKFSIIDKEPYVGKSKGGSALNFAFEALT